MTDKKLTDNEIIKALECCQNQHGYDCDDCPYQENKHFDEEKGEFEIMPKGLSYDQYSCDIWLQIDTLDLINRQKEEIERLKEEIELLHSDYTYKFVREKAKAEAYKECIKKIKVKSKKEHLVYSGASLRTDYTITDKELDNLLKEMVGAEE